MVTSLHVATGAAVGALARSRRQAVVLGLVSHALGDRVPHQDNASRRFEIVSAAAGIMLLAATRGPSDRVTVAALAASVPDVEHVIRLPRPGGRKLFPSHRVHGWHRSGGLPAWAQVLTAGVLLGTLARPPGPGARR